MGERITRSFPFVIAVILPPAGVILGFVEMQQDREAGVRLIVVSLLAAVVWASLFLL
jgi:hypothetical protein